MKGMLPGLDVMRFSLACYLVFYHTLLEYPATQGMPWTDIFKFGGGATSIFFILSGFILSHVSVETTPDDRKKVSAFRFFINRFTNLYPIHIITLMFTVALMTVNFHPFDVELSKLDSAPSVMHTMSTAEVSINAILHVLLLQAWNPFYLSFNVPSWSLSTLFFFYLLFPAAAPRLLSARRKWLLLTAMWGASVLPAVIVLVNGWNGVWAIGTLHTNPLIRLPEFFAGILAYGIFAGHAQQITRIVTRYWRILIGMLAALFIGAAYLFAEGPSFWEVLLHNGLILPAQVAVIFVSASLLQRASPRVVGWTRRLGNASLSIFALQMPLFGGFLKVQKMLDIPYPLLSCVHRLHMCTEAASQVPADLSAYPIYLAMILVASILFQERIIAPLRSALRRVLNRRWGSPRLAQIMPTAAVPIVNAPELAARDGLRASGVDGSA